MNKALQTKKKFGLLSLVGILLVTVIIYSNSIKNEILFGWDDGEYIENEDIQNFNLEKFFSTYYLGMYQPLAVTSIAINHQISGSKASAYHGFNLVFHLLNIVLVFLLFKRLSKRLELAIIIAFLFAIHPMNVESVAWISARSTLLYSSFYLLGLLLYLEYINKKKYIFLTYSFLAFVLACFSKSMAITLPIVLFLFDYLQNRKIDTRAFIEKIPFLLISVIFGIVTINSASDFGHIKALDVEYNIIDRIMMLSYSIIFYLVKVFAPVNLSAIYAYPLKEDGFLPWEFYFGFIILIVLIYNIVKSGKFRKASIFSLFFFLVTIGLVLPLVWSRMFMLADRYTYLPYIGIFFFIAKFYLFIIEDKHKLLKNFKPYVTVAFLIFFLFLGITTFQRTKVWNDTNKLTTDVIEKDRSAIDVAFGHFFRGNVRDRNQDYKGALEDFNHAIELNPNYTMAYNNRGIVKGITQDFEGALQDFNKASELQPDYAEAIYNRGNAHYYLGHKDQACLDWKTATNMGSKQAEVIFKKYCNQK